MGARTHARKKLLIMRQCVLLNQYMGDWLSWKGEQLKRAMNGFAWHGKKIIAAGKDNLDAVLTLFFLKCKPCFSKPGRSLIFCFSCTCSRALRLHRQVASSPSSAELSESSMSPDRREASPADHHSPQASDFPQHADAEAEAEAVCSTLIRATVQERGVVWRACVCQCVCGRWSGRWWRWRWCSRCSRKQPCITSTLSPSLRGFYSWQRL